MSDETQTPQDENDDQPQQEKTRAGDEATAEVTRGPVEPDKTADIQPNR